MFNCIEGESAMKKGSLTMALKLTNGHRGFTLLEIFVAVVTLAILATIAVPGFTVWLPNKRLKGAVRDLKSDMELSKLRAVRENGNVALTFDTENNTYTVFVDNGAGGGTASDWIRNGSEAVIKTVVVPPDVTLYEARFAGGAPRCRFDGRGLPNGLGGHVYMRNTRNNYLGLALSMVGHVQIRESADNGATWDDVE
jgi:type IV fimbrial biogenesis protein FimT